MNIIKKTAITFFMAISLGASSIASAEEAAAVIAAPANSLNETIAHIEAGLAEVTKSDFAAAQLHLKAARESSATITGNEEIVKQGNDSTIKGQVFAKTGESEKSAVELNKALGFYKSI